MTEKEVEAFKNRIKNYTFIKEQNDELKEEIELKWYNLTGVKGISFNRSAGTTNESAKMQKKLKEYDEIEKLEKKIQKNEEEIAKLDSMLEQIPNFEREIVIDKFLHNYSYDELSKKCYMDKSTLKRRIDRELARISYI